MIRLPRIDIPAPLGDPRALALSHERLAYITSARELVVWDLNEMSFQSQSIEAPWQSLVWMHDRIVLPACTSYGLDIMTFGGSREPLTRFESGYEIAEPMACDGERIVARRGEAAYFARRDEIVAEFRGERDYMYPRRASFDPCSDRFAISFDEESLLATSDGVVDRFEGVKSIVFLDDGRFATSGREGAQVRTTDGRVEMALPHDFESGFWTGESLLVWGHDSAALYDPDGGEIWSTRYHNGIQAAVAGDRFYTVGRDGWIGVRDIQSGVLERVLPTGSGPRVSAMAFVGCNLVVADAAQRVVAWSLEKARPDRVLDASSLGDDPLVDIHQLGIVRSVFGSDEIHLVGTNHFAWSPESERLESHDYDGKLIGDRFTIHGEWEDSFATLTDLLKEWPEYEIPIGDLYEVELEIDLTERRLLVSRCRSQQSILRVWDLKSSSWLAELSISAPPRFVRFDAHQDVVGLVYSGADPDEDKPVYFRWDPHVGTVERWLEIDPDSTDVAISENLDVFWNGDALKLVQEGALVQEIESPWRISEVALSERYVAIATELGFVAWIDLETEEVKLVCSTADGGWWSFVDGELWQEPGEWT